MRRIIFTISILLYFAGSAAAASETPTIAEVDRIRIAEAFRIGEKLQDELWADWSTAPFGILFITDDYEFLIRHEKPNDEFKSIGHESDRLRRATEDEMKKLDLSSWERTVFYPFGAIEGLVLDRINPKWQDRYFNEKFELEKFYL
jgi:hypothetical protein